MGLQGDRACWDATFTFERCCRPALYSEGPPISAVDTSEVTERILGLDDATNSNTPSVLQLQGQAATPAPARLVFGLSPTTSQARIASMRSFHGSSAVTFHVAPLGRNHAGVKGTPSNGAALLEKRCLSPRRPRFWHRPLGAIPLAKALAWARSSDYLWATTVGRTVSPLALAA